MLDRFTHSPIRRSTYSQLRSAFGAELGPFGRFLAAAAALEGRGQFRTALRAELGAMSLGMAAWTDELDVRRSIHLLAGGVAVGAADLSGSGRHARRLRGFHLHNGIWRAVVAKSGLRVKALHAHVLEAFGASMEVLLRLDDGIAERVVPGRLPSRVCKRIGRVVGFADKTPQEARCRAKPTGGLGLLVGLEARPVGVAASFAVELELEAGVDAARYA